MTAQPKYATKPDPKADHDTPGLIAAARVLGKNLLPWQIDAGRIITEKARHDPNRYRYRLVLITVPRQCGKTVMVGCEFCRRTIATPNRGAWYTAQTGKDARERHGDLRKMVTLSMLNRHANIALRAGAETITWPNGSFIRAFAPTVSSLHGYTPDTVGIDEAWKFTYQQGNDLLGAISPAQITLPHRQLLIFSTMGSAESGWFHELVERGRASVEDPDADMAYIEYSLPDGLDLYDPKSWPLFHPGLGHLITEEDLATEAEKMPAGEFARAYGNIRTSALETVVSIDALKGLADAEISAGGRPIVLAYDVAHDGSRAAIVAAWHGEHGGPAVRVVYSAPGSTWLREMVPALRVEHSLRVIGADDGGPAREVTDRLRRDGVPLQVLGARDYATACGAILGHVRDGSLRHDGSPNLVASFEAAVTRPMGDSVAFSRRQSRGPIPELVAAAVAVRLLEHAPAPAPRPYIGSRS